MTIYWPPLQLMKINGLFQLDQLLLIMRGTTNLLLLLKVFVQCATLQCTVVKDVDVRYLYLMHFNYSIRYPRHVIVSRDSAILVLHLHDVLLHFTTWYV